MDWLEHEKEIHCANCTQNDECFFCHFNALQETDDCEAWYILQFVAKYVCYNIFIFKLYFYLSIVHVPILASKKSSLIHFLLFINPILQEFNQKYVHLTNWIIFTKLQIELYNKLN